MSRYGESQLQVAFPKPRKVGRALLMGVFAVWLAFAIGINWAGVPVTTFTEVAGNTQSILQGQVWRLVTAPWLHSPHELGHILFSMLGLYFFSPALEEAWGSKRFARFLFASSLIAYGSQMLVELAVPSLAARLVPDYWFGALPVTQAITIAWALTVRGRARLFFMLPVSPRALIWFVLGVSVMYVIVAAQTASGLIAPFGGMFAGWLLGGSTPSPLRRAWLKLRLAQLDAEARREARVRKGRIGRSGLRVIKGGRRERDSDSGSESGSSKRDDRWLN